MTHSRWLALGLLLSVACGIQANFVSSMLHPRFEHHEEALRKEQAIIRGEAYVIDGRDTYWPEFQNRILFSFFLRAVSSIDVLSPSEWYSVLRVVLSILAFFCLWSALTRSVRAPPLLAAGAMILTAYILAPHFNHGWEHPSDYLDPIFIVGMLWAATEHRRTWLAVIALLCVLNRESAPFAGVFWGFLYGIAELPGKRWFSRYRIVWREAAFASALTFGAYAGIIVARRSFGGTSGTQVLQHTAFSVYDDMILDFLRQPAPQKWPFLAFSIATPLLLWLCANRRYLRQAEHRLLLAAGAIGIVTAVFSLLHELRAFIPASMVLVYVATAAEARRWRSGGPSHEAKTLLSPSAVNAGEA